MRTKILLLIILIGIISSNNLNAQECGTPTSGSNQEFTSTYNKSTNEESICINVFFHIVRQSNGTGGFNATSIDLIVDDLNEYYNPFDIYINKQGVDFIDNSTYYDLTNNEFNGLIGINNSSNSINFYLVNSAPYAGRAEAILSKNLVVYNSYALSPTSAHELGHCLNLWHTHHGLGCNDLGGCAEAIDGSNSATCGDFITDTPADPCVLGQVNGNCQYTGGGGYNPDPTNIMSYGGSCRNHFTTGQAERIRNTILGSSLLQQVIGTSCLIPEINGPETICDSSGTTYNILNGGNSVAWNVSSNLTILSQNQNSITVKPITTSTSGAGFIEAVLPTQTMRKDIWIGKPNITLELEPQGTNYVMVEMVGANGSNINQQGITSTTWQKISSSGGCYASFGGSGFTGLGHGNCNSWSVYAKITATNSCGTTTIYRTITPPAPDPCDEYYKIANTSKNTYEVMRIIDPCAKTNSNQKLSQSSSNENVSIQVLDIYGNTMIETKHNHININNLKSGIYIIRVNINNEILTHKIIKQ